jgi:hypothetical protein
LTWIAVAVRNEGGAVDPGVPRGANALEVVDPVKARRSREARVARTFINLYTAQAIQIADQCYQWEERLTCFTVDSSVARQAGAFVRIDKVYACATVLAGVAVALIDI